MQNGQPVFPRSRLRTVVAALALAISGSAMAHAVALWAERSADQVIVEAYFSHGTGVQGAKVMVRDRSGSILIEGITDDKGRFEFTTSHSADLIIELMVDDNHSKTFVLKSAK